MKSLVTNDSSEILNLSSISAFSPSPDKQNNYLDYNNNNNYDCKSSPLRRKKQTSFIAEVNDNDECDDDDDVNYDESDDASDVHSHEERKTSGAKDNNDDNTCNTHLSPSSSSSYNHQAGKRKKIRTCNVTGQSITLLAVDLNAVDQIIFSHILSDRHDQVHCKHQKDPLSSSFNIQHLLSSLSVALTSVSCNHNLNNKFISPVQEIMNFITDAEVNIA